MGTRRKPILSAGQKKLDRMGHDELVGVIEKLAEFIADIDATTNGKCGCCGVQEYSHHKYTPHDPSCPIAQAMAFCRDAFPKE